jgi:hypothetical protein
MGLMGGPPPGLKPVFLGLFGCSVEAEPFPSVREIGFRCKIGFNEIGFRN